MDAVATHTEERKRNAYSISDSSVPEIANAAPAVEFKDFDLVRDIHVFLPLFLRAWKETIGEDKSKIVKMILAGKEFEGPEIEFLVYHYLHTGSKIRLCHIYGELAGFCIYAHGFEGLISIRFMYFEKICRESSLAAKLVDSIPNVKAIIFQTQKKIPPDALFKAVGVRTEFMYETEDMKTWFMRWERN